MSGSGAVLVFAWAMLNAPLFAGTDLGALSTSDIQTLTLSGGGYAIALLNRGDTEFAVPAHGVRVLKLRP